MPVSKSYQGYPRSLPLSTRPTTSSTASTPNNASASAWYRQKMQENAAISGCDGQALQRNGRCRYESGTGRYRMSQTAVGSQRRRAGSSSQHKPQTAVGSSRTIPSYTAPATPAISSSISPSPHHSNTNCSHEVQCSDVTSHKVFPASPSRDESVCSSPPSGKADTAPDQHTIRHHPPVHNTSAETPATGKPLDWTKEVGKMRIFITFEGERRIFDVGMKESISELKERAREAFVIGPDEGPAGMELEDQKILMLSYHGAMLGNHWTLADLGVQNGSTIRALLQLEVKPSLYVYCAFNDETVPITDKINIQRTTIAALRGMVSRQTGLPVTVFRILTPEGRELYDGKLLEDYSINLRDTLRLDVWDGWKEFLNLCIMGFTPHVMSHLPTDDVMARFYQKVAMYVAAHFGHVELAITLLKQGIRADEAIGEHPMRQWCKHEGLHIDAHKAPVHEAAEAGSLSVLRSFVHSNVCNVLAKDGNDLTPLNLALRKKQKPCASFLLTKQWSKIGYTKKHSVHLSIYVKMLRWAERSRNKVLVIYGQWKSSIKNPKKHIQIGALLGQGVQLDGFSKSRMTSMPEAEYQEEQEAERARKERMYSNPIPPDMDPDVYFRSMRQFQKRLKLPGLNKFSKIMQKASNADQSASDVSSESELSDGESTEENFDSKTRGFRPRSNSHSGVRLPPINENKKALSTSQHNLSTMNIDDTEFRRGEKAKQSENKRNNLKHAQSRQSLGDVKSRKSDDDEETPRKKKKERNHSAHLIAKAKTEAGTIPLPMISDVGVPRPFIKSSNEDLTRGTLNLYEKYRGLGSRDYAIKCLTVANSFSEKPWLQQVQQALTISKQGVKKSVQKEPHMFTPRDAPRKKKYSIGTSSLVSTPDASSRRLGTGATASG